MERRAHLSFGRDWPLAAGDAGDGAVGVGVEIDAARIVFLRHDVIGANYPHRAIKARYRGVAHRLADKGAHLIELAQIRLAPFQRYHSVKRHAWVRTLYPMTWI